MQPPASGPTAPAPTPVFIFGGHRSGTTLLQRVLNSYDDVLIWGEHAGFLRPLADAFFSGWEHAGLFAPRKPLTTLLRDSEPFTDWQAWMNWFERVDWMAAFRGQIEGLLRPGGLPGKRFWGFKEIRYMRQPGDRTLELLATLYPEAIFVFIVRNAFNVIASNRKSPEGAQDLAGLKRVCDAWTTRYRAYREWHASPAIRSHWIVYEELHQGRGELHRLLGAMGKTFGERQRAVLDSAGGRRSSFADAAFDERWAGLPATWLGVAHAAVGKLNAELGYTNPRVSPVTRLVGRIVLAALALRGDPHATTGEASGAPAAPVPDLRTASPLPYTRS